MSEYIRRNWKKGEEISADKLNNIETGISEAKFESSIAANEAAAAHKYIDGVVEELGEQYKFEKLVEVYLAEVTTGFYIELPKTLSNYPVLFFKAANLKDTSDSTSGTMSVCAVESTASTTALFELVRPVIGRTSEPKHHAAIIMPTLKSDGTICGCTFHAGTGHGEVENIKFDGADTRYLYCKANNGLSCNVGCHFEFWGPVK